MFALARILVGLGMGLFACAAASGEVLQHFWIGILPLVYAAFWCAIRIWASCFSRQTTYQNHDWAFGLGDLAIERAWAFRYVACGHR